MKSLAIIALVGAIAYMLGADLLRHRWEQLKVAYKADAQTSGEIPPLTPVVARATVATNAPVPEVNVSKTVTMRGRVTAIDGERATVNCDYVPQFAPQALAAWNQSPAGNGGGGNGGTTRSANAQADEEASSDLHIADSSGRLVPVRLVPEKRLSGQAVLVGATVATGEVVNLVVTPVQNGIYTARFKPTNSGAWMWDRNAGSLNQKPR